MRALGTGLCLATVRYGGGGDADPGPPEAPDPPTELTAGSIGELGFTLGWTAPAGGAEVEGYEVEVQEAGGDWSTPVYEGTSATTSKVVTGLEGNVAYDARVRAANGTGESGWLVEEELVLTLPAAPEGVDAHGDEETVEVTWEVEPGLTYKLFIGTEDDFETASEEADEEPGPAYDFEGLTGGVLYYVWVVATNATGDSAPGGASAEAEEAGLVTSYGPPFGSGDRTATIAVTKSEGVLWTGALSTLVDGAATSGSGWFNVFDVAGEHITFEFPVEVLVKGLKFHQQTSHTQGTWKCQISMDGTSFTDVGDDFVLGGATEQTVTTMAGNTAGCMFLRLEGVSGSSNNTPYVYEFEFDAAVIPTEPSYDHVLGSGDRTLLISLSTTGGLTLVSPTTLLDGDSTPPDAYFGSAAVAGKRMVFEFPFPVLITEMRWKQQVGATQTHGVWKTVISNDGSSWSDVGGSFTLGGEGTQTITSLNGNTTPCEFLALEGVSGSTDGNPWLLEVEFKIATA